MNKLLLSLLGSIFMAGGALAQANLPKNSAECVAAIKKDNAAFKAAMDKGIKSGKIDKKEQAELTKSHGDLMAMERKAAADKKMSKEECGDILKKIGEQRKQFAEAMGRKGVAVDPAMAVTKPAPTATPAPAPAPAAAAAPAAGGGWVAVKGGAVPANALVGGQLTTGQPLVVCRADMGNGIHPGKVWKGKCYVGFGGKEVAKDAFEVFTK